MKEKFNVYIDESGDEGIKKGSRYFILTALIVNEKDVINASNCMDIVKKRILKENPFLHWNKLHGRYKKIYLLKSLANQAIVIINVIVDTSCVKYITSSLIYSNYIMYLFERVSWFLKANCGYGNIYLSSRCNLCENTLIKYIKRFNNIKFNINLKRVNNLSVVDNQTLNLLQYADACTSALFQALKYNNTTHFEYIKILLPKILRNKNNYLSYGLKIVPKDSYSVELKNLLEYLNNKG